MTDSGQAAATAPAGTGGVNGDLPLNLAMYRDMQRPEPKVKPEQADVKPPTQPETATADDTTRQSDSAPPKPEPISDELAGRARVLGMSEDEIAGYATPKDLDRFVTMTERNIGRVMARQQQQPRPEEQQAKPQPEAKPEPQPDDDWEKSVVEKFKGRGYDAELVEDMGELTAKFKSQLSKRDGTIAELREAMKKVEQHLVWQEQQKEVGKVGKFIN